MFENAITKRFCVAATRTSVLVVAFFALLCATASQGLAAQSASTRSVGSTAGTDALERFIDIIPGSAVQPGTATPVASGVDLAFSVDLGRVPDARIFNDAFRITNTDVVAHTIRVVPVGSGLGAISSVAFTNDSNPLDGPTIETIQPGATEILEIATTTSVAGTQAGSLRFTQVGDDRFFRRDLPIQTKQAPGAPTGLAATSTSGPNSIALTWNAPASSGVAGYNVYRASAAGGPYSKINGSLVAATNFNDSTATTGTRYWYLVTAVASGVSPELEGVGSAVVSGRVPPTPVSVSIPAGATNPANYLNSSTAGSATVRVNLPAATEAGDIVNVQLTDGSVTVGASATTTAAGAQTVDVTGVNASTLAEGAVTLRAWITKPNETGASVSGSAVKDTIAAVAGSRIVATASNPVDYINIATGIAPGTATAGVDLPAGGMTTDTVSVRLTMGANTVIGSTAGLAGAGTVLVPGLSTNGWAQGTVTVAARVQDVAGNDSGWIAGTPATRDTIAPPPPTAARILASLVNPIDTINIATAAATNVTVTTNGTASSVEVRLTRGATQVFGTLVGTGTIAVPVNASTLADGGPGTVQVAARQYDLAGNPSSWFVGNAARKDTVLPGLPDFNRIFFDNRWGGRVDRVTGNNGALGARDEVRIHDYADGLDYPAAGWDAANNQGAFGRDNISSGAIPRTLGYDIRDSAWNQIPRVCRYYTGDGYGVATACP